MATRVFGRWRRSSGGATDHHHRRHIYFTDVSKSHYEWPKPGLVGPKTTIVAGMPHPKHTQMRPKKAHLRLRRLPCGHGVFMVRGQYPDEETFCIQCRDGLPVR